MGDAPPNGSDRDHMQSSQESGQALERDAHEDGALDWSLMPLASGSDDSVVMVALQRIRREPALLFTTAYLLVSLLGLWCSYWFFWGFDLPILEYLQAGSRTPATRKSPACRYSRMGRSKPQKNQ